MYTFITTDDLTGVVMSNIGVSAKIHTVIKTRNIHVINGKVPQQASQQISLWIFFFWRIKQDPVNKVVFVFFFICHIR
ncbi:hypothetical protein D3C73_1109570 [compost metagenome]